MRFEAKGHSMYPFIQDGDIIVVEPTEFSHLCLGEIVLYHVSDKAILAHRMVGRMQRAGIDYLLARGDAIWGLDGPVSPTQILGRITALERCGCLIRVDGMGSRWLGLVYSNGHVLYRRADVACRRLAARGKAALRRIVRRITQW